jgi:hypothetical protein
MAKNNFLEGLLLVTLVGLPQWCLLFDCTCEDGWRLGYVASAHAWGLSFAGRLLAHGPVAVCFSGSLVSTQR